MMKRTPEERKKMLLLVLPAVLLIVAAIAFGVYSYQNRPEQKAAAQGINTHLPGAQFKTGPPVTKMSAYDQAQKDSLAAKNKSTPAAFAALGWGSPQPPPGSKTTTTSADASEAKITQKLAEINRQVNASEPSTKYQPQTTANNPDIDRLEKLLKQKQQVSQPDPEMAQLNNMLDKIQQIQNPALVKAATAVTPAKPDSAFKAIPATIDGSQKVMNGGVVKLKLNDTLRVGGLMIPKGQSLSGACSVTNQRLLLEIKNIRMGTSIVPVSLTVFSLDGMAGIAAPEAELGEAAGSGTAGALDNMEFMGMDQTLGTQAATAGIAAAKGLIGKKARRIRVRLKGGQAVLLKVNRN
jgi:hypothetical protein